MVSHWLDGWAKERAGEAASGTGAKETAGRFPLDNVAWAGPPCPGQPVRAGAVGPAPDRPPRRRDPPGARGRRGAAHGLTSDECSHRRRVAS